MTTTQPGDLELPEGWIETTALDDDERVFLDPAGNQYSHDDLMQIVSKDYPEAWNPPVPVPSPVHTWQDSDPEQLKQGLQVRTENRTTVMDWVREALVDGTDFGRIHIAMKDANGQKCKKGNRCTEEWHWSKPSLWKAGAEKIAGMLGLRPVWPRLAEIGQMVMEGHGRIVLTCILVNSNGDEISQGIGARMMSDDYDNINKAIKMAKKSSLIDAVLNACGMSEVFTQDLSDDESPQDNAGATLDADGVRYLLTCSRELFGDDGDQVVKSLARRRFHIDDGDPYKIPAYRLQDAIRSLEERASENGEADG